MSPRANPTEKSDDENLLIAVLSQWDPASAIDNHKLGAALGIKAGTAAVRCFRFKAKLSKNDGSEAAGNDTKLEQTSAKVNDPVQHKPAGDISMIGQKTTMTKKLVKGKQGKGNRKRPAMKGPIKQASTAVTNTFLNITAADSLGVGQVIVRIDQTPSTKPEKRGRKRAAVRGVR